MPKRVLLSGNEAVATALRQINPDVFPLHLQQKYLSIFLIMFQTD